jgi:hypothetical protein
MERNNKNWALLGCFFMLFYSMHNGVFGQSDTSAQGVRDVVLTPDMFFTQKDTLVYREVYPNQKEKEKKCSLEPLVNIGFILPPKDNTNYRVRYGKSLQGTLGLQYKARLAKFYAMGLDVRLSGNHYNIRQDDGKWFMDTNRYQKETFSTGDISLAFTHQFKLNSGVFPTWLLEAAVFGSYVYSARHKTINVHYNTDDIYAEKTRTKNVYSKLSYLEHWIWGLQLRLTYHGVGIYAQYRMNHLLKLGRPEDYPAFDMPQLSVGLTFSESIFDF